MILTDPYTHQLIAARQLHRFGGRMLLADEVGVGKSLSALLYAHQRELFPMLIVCPKSLKWNWAKEAKLHFGTDSLVLDRSRPYLDIDAGKQAPITIINYDVVISQRGKGQGWMKWLLDVGYEYLIIDEGHYLACRTSKRTKACSELCSEIPKVCILTGTPFTSEPAQIWPMLNMLRPDVWHSFRDFAWNHCDPKRSRFHGGWEFKGAVNMDRLHQKLEQHVMLRRTKAEVLSELPARTRCVLPLPIANEKEYRKAETDFIAWMRENMDAGRVRSAMKAEALVKVNYLKQLAAKLKMPAVINWIEDFLMSGKKLIIFCTHRRVVTDLRSRWRSISVEVQGDTPARERQNAVNRFQNEKQCRLFIGNLKAAGVGITLTAASDVAFVEYGWTPGEHFQGEGRADRISQTEPVTCWWLVAKDTIEEKIVELLQKKHRVFTDAIDGGVTNDDLNVFDQLCEVMN